jgi:hypothetical protein
MQLGAEKRRERGGALHLRINHRKAVVSQKMVGDRKKVIAGIAIGAAN